MLILCRKLNETIIVGNNVEIKILSISNNKVKLGFSAPKDVPVHRREVYESIQKRNIQKRK